MLSKRFHDVKLLVAGVRPWASQLSFFGFNGVQDTFIDYFGVWPWTSHGFTYDLFLCRTLLFIILLPLLDCGRANHFFHVVQPLVRHF
jgi:hypothetical protein